MDTGKSFTATLRMIDHKVNLLEVLHGKPALATVGMFSGGAYTGKPQSRDHSALLGILPNAQSGPVRPLILHLRHTSAGYILSIKNKGEYYDRIVSQSWQEILGAADSNISEPSVFTIIDQHNKPIAFDNPAAIHTPVSLMTDDNKYIGGLRLRGSPYVYLAATDERSKITFILSISDKKLVG